MTYSKEKYLQALQAKGVLNERRIAVLKVFAQFPGYRACGKDIGSVINAKSGFVNLVFGQLSKAICKYFKLERFTSKFDSTDWWPVLATGKKEKDGFYWTLKKPFIEALMELGVFSEGFIYPEEAGISDLLHMEGSLKKVLVNAYERNMEARAACIKHFGAICKVCNIDFEKQYGSTGKGFIHVHHIEKISEKGGKAYSIDPIKNLIPVCPNCHAMLHQRKEPFTVDELKKKIKYVF